MRSGRTTAWWSPRASARSRRGWPGPPGTCRPVPKEKMRELLERRDGPAVRDTLLWFAPADLLRGPGLRGCGASWWAVLPFAAYGVLYGSTSDSRWHEPLHGTAFKTDWLNNALYELASFMVMRESTLWRWSHIAAPQRHDHRGPRSGNRRPPPAATPARCC